MFVPMLQNLQNLNLDLLLLESAVWMQLDQFLKKQPKTSELIKAKVFIIFYFREQRFLVELKLLIVLTR